MAEFSVLNKIHQMVDSLGKQVEWDEIEIHQLTMSLELRRSTRDERLAQIESWQEAIDRLDSDAD